MKGRGGMGSHKHGVSGHAGKSPKLRMAERLAAERAPPKKNRTPPLTGGSVKDVFETKKEPQK